jgi:hypothetical protein
MAVGATAQPETGAEAMEVSKVRARMVSRAEMVGEATAEVAVATISRLSRRADRRS